MDEKRLNRFAWKALHLRDTALGMSQENVEIISRIYERLNRGDVDGVIELCDEGFVLDMSERVFNPDVYRGRDDIRRFHEGVAAAWESYRWDVEETRVADDIVVALLHCKGTSREGGPQVDWRVAWVWRLNKGRAVSARFHRDRGEALKVAGLSALALNQLVSRRGVGQ